MEEGKPIWVESLMSPEEWKKNSRIYTTYSVSEPPKEFDGEFKWRKGMGKSLDSKEITVINTRLEAVKKLIK